MSSMAPWLRWTLWVAAGGVLCLFAGKGKGSLMESEALAADAVTDGRAPVSLAPGPHLFLDDFLIDRSEGVTRAIQTPARDLPGPVVTGREDGNFQPYVTVLRDPKAGRFRMWYDVAESASQAHIGYLESEDGVHWLRPHRVLSDPDRIQVGAGVIDEGPAFPDAAKRFKLATWHDGGMKIAVSPDGLVWKPLAPGVLLPHNHDINSLHWDPTRKRYLALVSSYGPGPTWKGTRRHTLESTSPDLIHWEQPWPILTPDDTKDQGETQFYCMSGVLARGDLLIGMLKVLRDDLPADPGGPAAGLGYTVLAWSHDGKSWTRDREPFLDRDSRPGAWDHAMSWADCQLPAGEQVFIYYGGYARGHKVERFTERQIGLVRIRRDRYVARQAEQEGTLRTPLVTLSGRSMTLNADARGGEIRVRLLDPAGKPLAGFSFEDCRPVTEDSLAAPVQWKRALERLKGRPVRLGFSLRRAKLFAFDLVP